MGKCDIDTLATSSRSVCAGQTKCKGKLADSVPTRTKAFVPPTISYNPFVQQVVESPEVRAAAAAAAAAEAAAERAKRAPSFQFAYEAMNVRSACSAARTSLFGACKLPSAP